MSQAKKERKKEERKERKKENRKKDENLGQQKSITFRSSPR